MGMTTVTAALKYTSEVVPRVNWRRVEIIEVDPSTNFHDVTLRDTDGTAVNVHLPFARGLVERRDKASASIKMGKPCEAVELDSGAWSYNPRGG